MKKKKIHSAYGKVHVKDIMQMLMTYGQKHLIHPNRMRELFDDVQCHDDDSDEQHVPDASDKY